jgi:hypothetical protein
LKDPKDLLFFVFCFSSSHSFFYILLRKFTFLSLLSFSFPTLLALFQVFLFLLSL